jgi:hypothetical protein
MNQQIRPLPFFCLAISSLTPDGVKKQDDRLVKDDSTGTLPTNFAVAISGCLAIVGLETVLRERIQITAPVMMAAT